MKETKGTSAAARSPAGQYLNLIHGRLRAIRRQKGLSLHDVEARSSLEFKASVLGAYERGERAISVPRLQRLARLYRVPVDQLLPRDPGDEFGAALVHRAFSHTRMAPGAAREREGVVRGSRRDGDAFIGCREIDRQRAAGDGEGGGVCGMINAE